MRRCFLLGVMIFSLIVLPGCWDSKELEQRASVIALGIDEIDNGANKQPLYKVSIQIPIPIKIAGAGGGGNGGGGGQKAVKTMSATGLSVTDAFIQLQNRLNQELFFGHTRVIAVSEKVARHEIIGIADSLRRNPQMRRLLWMVNTKGDAAELLQADPKLEQIPMVYVMDMMENGAKQGRIPNVTLGRWFNDSSSTGIEPSANYIETSNKEVKWAGLTVFYKDKMVGTIPVQEAWVLLQVRDKQIGGNVTIPCPMNPSKHTVREYITVHPKKVHVKTDVQPYDNHFRMVSNVTMEVDVIESMCKVDFTKKEVYKIVEKALTDEMNKRAQKLIADAQGKFHSDIFGMGNKVRAKYMDEFEQRDWSKEFQKAKIEIHYDVMIRRGGMKLN